MTECKNSNVLSAVGYKIKAWDLLLGVSCFPVLWKEECAQEVGAGGRGQGDIGGYKGIFCFFIVQHPFKEGVKGFYSYFGVNQSAGSYSNLLKMIWHRMVTEKSNQFSFYFWQKFGFLFIRQSCHHSFVSKVSYSLSARDWLSEPRKSLVVACAIRACSTDGCWCLKGTPVCEWSLIVLLFISYM